MEVVDLVGPGRSPGSRSSFRPGRSLPGQRKRSSEYYSQDNFRTFEFWCRGRPTDVADRHVNPGHKPEHLPENVNKQFANQKRTGTKFRNKIGASCRLKR